MSSKKWFTLTSPAVAEWIVCNNMFYMGREQKLMLCAAYWELRVKNHRLYCQTPNLQFMILICYSSQALELSKPQWNPFTTMLMYAADLVVRGLEIPS